MPKDPYYFLISSACYKDFLRSPTLSLSQQGPPPKKRGRPPKNRDIDNSPKKAPAAAPPSESPAQETTSKMSSPPTKALADVKQEKKSPSKSKSLKNNFIGTLL